MRVDPHKAASELQSLGKFLDFQRETVKWKLEGVSQVDANKNSVPTSQLTLAGVVKHLALVEDHWFQSVFLGVEMPSPWLEAPFGSDPDWEFHSATGEPLEDVLALYDLACARSREVLTTRQTLDALSVGTDRSGDHCSFRWILLHMVEETARHNGHIDLIREAIDGSTGE